VSASPQSSKTTSLVAWIGGIVICFASAVISNTKNGILISLFIISLLGGIFAGEHLKKKI